LAPAPPDELLEVVEVMVLFIVLVEVPLGYV